MNLSDPSDPLPILRAIKELARGWEAESRIAQDTDDADARPVPALWDMSAAQLKVRFGSFAEASASVFRHAVISLKIRVWIEDGANWKRPTLQTIRALLPPESGLYVDQEEVRRVFSSQWPTAFEIPTLTPLLITGQHAGSRKRRGRTPGSGSYEVDDAPLILEMRDLIRTRQARSVKQAAEMVVKRAVGGGTDASRATRLRKGYKAEFGSGA